MGLSDILDSIKEKVPFLKREEELGADFEDIEAGPGLETPPTELETPSAEGLPPPPEEYQEPEAPHPKPAPTETPAPPTSAPTETPTQPTSAQDFENLKLMLDNIKQRIENLAHRFDTLSTEMDTFKSEADFEKSLLQRYDYYLHDIVNKIDTLEKQHEAMWNELKGTATQSP